jgi:hypothetical protein
MARRKPPLNVEQILAWADALYARTGKWPTAKSGPIPEAPGEVWGNIEGALHNGYRGLPRFDSLAKLLDRHRGARRKLSRFGRPAGPGEPGDPGGTLSEEP